MSRPLQTLPVSSIALALGLCVAAPSSREPGRVGTLCAELRRRGVYDDMLAALDPGLAASIATVEMADRGAMWSASRHRRPPSDNTDVDGPHRRVV